MLTVSIVYYNNAELIRAVLPRTLSAIGRAASRCYLIDNASVDETAALLKAAAPPGEARVQYVHSDTNIGFGRAHNLVLDRLDAKYHLICNPDIIIDNPSALHRCIEFLESHPDVGLMTVRLLNEDGTLQAVNKQRPNVLDLFLRRAFPTAQWPWLLRRMERYEMRDVGYDRVVDVPFVTGAFMMIRTPVFRAVGGFDPRYFLYFEDADLSRRVQESGYRTVYFPGVTLVHLWQRAAHKDARVGRILVENGVRYFNKWGWKWC